MLLRTLRDGLAALLTTAHPAVMAAEEARGIKEAERYRRMNPEAERAAPLRVLEASVPRAELPQDWQVIFDTLLAGRKVRRRRLARATINNVTAAARQLIRAARDAGLPDELSLDTISAYDRALEARSVRPTSCAMQFEGLRMLGLLIGSDQELVADIVDLIEHYQRDAKGTVKLKEHRLADLPDLRAIFDTASALLDRAAATTDRRSLTSLYVDAAALAFLSLIPLRNQDTVLVWGREIRYIGDDDPADWGLEDHDEPLGYYIDLRTSKCDTALSGPLAPILTPFLDALILRGQDERLLPDLRRRIIAARAPVFPKSNGQPRSVRGLSSRWRVHLGTGSVISRTRIHTLLGALGERGVRAALALCAQRSHRTAKWYQAQALDRRLMLESQEMIASLVEITPEDEALLASL